MIFESFSPFAFHFYDPFYLMMGKDMKLVIQVSWICRGDPFSFIAINFFYNISENSLVSFLINFTMFNVELQISHRYFSISDKFLSLQLLHCFLVRFPEFKKYFQRFHVKIKKK